MQNKSVSGLESLTYLSLSPRGHLKTIHTPAKDIGLATAIINDQKIITAFAASPEEGLLVLVGAKYDDSWSQSLKFWRNYISLYVHNICHYTFEPNVIIEKISAPNEDKLGCFVTSIPPMPGAEYCSAELLVSIWETFDNFIRNKIITSYNGINDFLAKELPFWHQIGRVCFHLAENKNDERFPFAFIATYAASLNINSKVQHKPLSQALLECAGDENNKNLANLLRPIHNAAKNCAWLNELVESHDIYHPLAWVPQDAYNLLKSVPVLEEAGLVVKIPNWWQKKSKPKVQVTIGDNKNEHFGAQSLLQFDVNITLHGEKLTKKELDEIMANSNGLVLLRGQWIELDKEKLSEALAHWQQVQKEAGDGVSFIEGMRLLAGINKNLENSGLEDGLIEWCGVEASARLKDIMALMRDPKAIKINNPGDLLKTELRHYQESGLAWLDLLTTLGLGACLADDMGLGKTIQIIALLLIKKKRNNNFAMKKASILILPASLLANWKAELAKFAPSIKAMTLHTAELSRADLAQVAQTPESNLFDCDLVITTYASLLRQEWLTKLDWDLVILDEAQAIKNPASKQTKLAKKLNGDARIALTGTPVENRLGDLWSIFDFICPGLLGSSTRFKDFLKAIDQAEHNSYAKLRKLVSPYILRRLKTDKNIISDLPDKTEVKAWCGLSRTQIKLYSQTVNEMAKALQTTAEGIKRRGLVLSYLTKFKQICNHPSQLFGDGEYSENHSGKFARLREICEEIYSRQEKVLVFTQYREMTGPLQRFLANIFGEQGLVLDGSTAIKQRQKLVDNFQSDYGSQFFILSLKAAGIGLNLTAASHVVHFDRWWNPAVENQATDRAYRIGQKKNVLVHKFICKGTLEEKIDALINDKQQLANNILDSGSEIMLTEIDDNALLKLVALDIDTVIT